MQRRSAAIIRWNKHEMRELPARSTTWQWSDVECSQSTLAKMRDAGMIERHCGGWRVTLHVEAYLADQHDIELVSKSK